MKEPGIAKGVFRHQDGFIVRYKGKYLGKYHTLSAATQIRKEAEAASKIPYNSHETRRRRLLIQNENLVLEDYLTAVQLSTIDRRKLITKLYKDGLPLSEIADTVNLTVAQVARDVKIVTDNISRRLKDGS
jgi:DNA-directed RNA polymerase specialized sigma subunit